MMSIYLSGKEPLQVEPFLPASFAPSIAAPVGKFAPAGLPQAFPSPTSPDAEAVSFWFRLLEALDDPRQKDGLTARQLARKLNLEHQESAIAGLLQMLADRRDLVRKASQPPRYRPQALARSLPVYLREEAHRSGAAWEQFDLAALAFADQPRALEWSALKEAFFSLIESLPAWPESVLREAKLNAERWVGPAANVTPPSFLAKEDDYAALRAEIDRLNAENARLKTLQRQQPDDQTGRKGELQRRLDVLERENGTLRQEVSSLRSDLEGFMESAQQPENHKFLEGSGRGPLPASLPASEIARMRKLILATKASPDVQLAMVRALGELHAAPTAFQRLTSMAFKEHRFDSVWRVRVLNYRIVYGLRGALPEVLEIEVRGKVYAEAVKKL